MALRFAKTWEEEAIKSNLEKILAMLCLKLGDLFNICEYEKLDLYKTKSGLQTVSGTNIAHKVWACGFMDAVK